jgi:hypothetical protein
MAEMPLYSDVDGVIGQLQTNLASAEALAQGLSKPQFNWCPEPARWSIAQCIGHLNLINGQDLTRLASVIDAARSRGVKGAGPFHYSWLSRKFVALMEPGAPKKFKAPKQFVPQPDAEIDITLAEYRRISNQLIQFAQNARGLDLSKVKTGLAGVPVVTMPLGARLSLLATHDSRHLWQAGEVLRDTRFPRPTSTPS